MAAESVATCSHAPDAMDYDSSVYIGWIRALTDLLSSCSIAGDVEPRTIPNVGGLLNALAEATEDLLERENKARRN